MDASTNLLQVWYEGLEKQARQGNPICPLMIREPGRFRSDLCRCDIPTVKTLYETSHQPFACALGDQCLPRIVLHEEVQEYSRRR